MPHVDTTTMTPRSEFVLRRRVQFYELDGAGIVHFSNYLRYMEEAEHAFWRAAGSSIHPAGSDIGWPRVSVSCDYHAPLRFEDEFEVHIAIAAMTEKSIRYTCVVRRGDVKVATGTIVTVCVRVADDGSMKAVPIPAAITERFAAGPAGEGTG